MRKMLPISAPPKTNSWWWKRKNAFDACVSAKNILSSKKASTSGTPTLLNVRKGQKLICGMFFSPHREMFNLSISEKEGIRCKWKYKISSNDKDSAATSNHFHMWPKCIQRTFMYERIRWEKTEIKKIDYMKTDVKKRFSMVRLRFPHFDSFLFLTVLFYDFYCRN